MDSGDGRLLRPKLRQDTAFLPHASGAYVRNDETAFLVKGETAYRWIAALAPLLTGEHTVEQLCERLPAAHQQTALQLIAVLLDRGFARDTSATATPANPDVSQAIQERFRQQLNFIEHYADDPVRRFATFRTADVLLVGNGEVLRAAAESLIDNGLARLSIAATDTDARAIQAHCDAPVTVTDLASDLRGRNYVAYCADVGDLRELAVLNARCVADGVPFVPLTRYGDLAVVGPQVRATGPCGMCLMLRLAANSPSEQAADAWRELATGLTAFRGILHAPVARMLGNAVGFELFRALAGGMPGDIDDAVVIYDVLTLVGRREPLLTHPLCPVCMHGVRGVEGAVPAVADSAAAAPEVLDEQARYARGNRLVGTYVGLFQGWADDPLYQAPLKAAALHIGPPSSGRELVAYRLEHVMAARVAVLTVAACDYAAGLVPHQLVHGTLAELATAGRTPVSPQTLSTWIGGPDIDHDTAIDWVPARSLLTGEQRFVPAAAAHPAGSRNIATMFELSPAGTAAGVSTAEATQAGLLSMLAYLRLRDLVRGCGGVISLHPDRLSALDPELAYLQASATSLGQPVRVLEAVGDSPIHVVIAIATDTPSTYAVGFGQSALDAARTALLDLVGQVQATERDGRVANLGPRLLPDLDPRAPLPSTDPDHSRLTAAPTTTSELHAWLRRAGRDSLVVDTTPPDLRTAGFVTGRVLGVEPVTRMP